MLKLVGLLVEISINAKLTEYSKKLINQYLTKSSLSFRKYQIKNKNVAIIKVIDEKEIKMVIQSNIYDHLD